MSDITELKLEFSSITSTTCCDKGTWANAAAAHSRTMAADTPLPSFFQFIEKSPQIVGRALAPLVLDTMHKGLSGKEKLSCGGWSVLRTIFARKKKIAREKYLVHLCRANYGDDAQRHNEVIIQMESERWKIRRTGYSLSEQLQSAGTTWANRKSATRLYASI